MLAPKTIRCAIYTRKSTEEGLEQDYNSLHAQRDALTQARDRKQSANKEGLHAAVLAVRTELQALAHAHQLI